MGQKGNNFVEYALMLGLVVGIGWGLLGSYGDGIPRIFGSAAELLQAGSKSDKVYDRHMKWLKDALLALAQKETGNGVQSSQFSTIWAERMEAISIKEKARSLRRRMGLSIVTVCRNM